MVDVYSKPKKIARGPQGKKVWEPRSQRLKEHSGSEYLHRHHIYINNNFTPTYMRTYSDTYSDMRIHEHFGLLTYKNRKFLHKIKFLHILILANEHIRAKKWEPRHIQKHKLTDSTLCTHSSHIHRQTQSALT